MLLISICYVVELPTLALGMFSTSTLATNIISYFSLSSPRRPCRFDFLPLACHNFVCLSQSPLFFLDSTLENMTFL